MELIADKVRRAKELAARKAFEAYRNELTAFFEANPEVELRAVTTESVHVHTALLVGGHNQVVLVRAQWEFSDRPEVIEMEIRKAKMEGSG